ncbi:MAG TPA: S53 family peptidase [Bryobacteraceae bacterium]|nr:S53 family peptidase [Bryobacteraceae bacterium]
MATKKVPLAGSERQPIGSRIADQPNDETIEVSVVLGPKTRARMPAAGAAPMSRDDFAQKHGADEKAVQQLQEFAKEYNLTVSEVSAPRRTVKLTGRAADLIRAFEVKLDRYEHNGHQYRARTGSIQLPADLAPHVEAVLGLDNRPQANPHFRVRPQVSSSNVSYTPRQVAQLYQFPLDANGKGETVGILELGGGYKPADLKNYFSSLGLKEPSVISVAVDGGKNSPSNANSADGEVLLDIEVVGAVAPASTIVVYFAPNTSQGFQDALTTAIHDTTHRVSVISISWGSAESTWTTQAMTAFDSAAQDAAALGVTVCAASGDNGSSDGVTDGKNHVDFPASSPHILACGGTSLQSASGKITSETVWNDGAQGGAGGGGFSNQFALPSYQSSAGIKAPSGEGRGVPDVSADADPETGYRVLVDGKSLVIGGTSGAAPLWSALIALINQKRGSPLGFLQPAIYGLPAAAGAFHDITSGSNGAFSAGPGWDPTTGLGSPSGEDLTAALSKTGAGAAT